MGYSAMKLLPVLLLGVRMLLSVYIWLRECVEYRRCVRSALLCRCVVEQVGELTVGPVMNQILGWG